MRRFFSFLGDCKIICCVSRASVSGFCANQSERALSLFARRARVHRITRGCVYTRRSQVYRCAIAEESISKLRKAVSRVTMRKENEPVERRLAARIGSPRERTAAPDDEITNFAFRRIPRFEVAMSTKDVERVLLKSLFLNV